MKNITTDVVHSQTKTAWNVIGDVLGGKYKIARVPYLLTEAEILNTVSKNEALEQAEFISEAFNEAWRKDENR